MKIEKAISMDSQRIYEIHTTAVRMRDKDFYTEEQVDAQLKNKTPQGYIPAIERGEMFVAKRENEILGFGHAIPGEVVAVFVDPKQWKQGAGKVLLKEGIRLARSSKSKTIIVEASLNAVPFYQKYGFEEKEKTNILRNGVEIPIIILELKK
ncbi:GNAT family N-acetyltransferase [bacterium]|jgi:putative acetyltransferase|nr:GNAT family N-acetyltransferase [bacterium]MBT6831618.1 GNAT family N-acetyltransferase [bacterium]MBT6996263.1 GNAT family N-acetyltransferase [bacterium]MBT7772941.1 GNAT family N-acetyltransferase [bacterium]